MAKMRTAISASGEQIVKVLGVTAPVPMETWQSNLTYRKLNIVRNSNGSTYIAKKDNTGIEPGITNGWEDVWQYILSDPQTAVESAQNYAEQAQESATSAVTAANNAQNSATNAATSETNAANSATQAATSETNASESATNAATSATQAANSANSIANSVDNLQSQIDGIYTVLNATVTNEVTVSEAYTSRETAGGLEIIDGALTQVESIQGDTVATSEGLKNAFFSSITSQTANLFGKTENYNTSQNNITVDYNAETGIWTINGTTTVLSFSFVINQLENWEGSQNFSMLFEKIGGTSSSESSSESSYLKIAVCSSDFSSFSPEVNETVPYRSISVSADTTKQPYLIVIILPEGNKTPVTFTNYQFRCMVQKGTVAQQDMAFQLYGVTDTLSVSTPIELTKYDTAYPADNKVVRGGKTLTQETPFTAEQLAQYTEYVLSQDGMTLVYKKDEPTEETVVFNKFFYKAYSGGMEYITQGATDNSEYGAECTVAQLYIEQKGGTQA